jgi:hypothetical protein
MICSAHHAPPFPFACVRTQLHETVFAVVFRMVRPYLFLLQMGQLPLIYLGRKLKNTYAPHACSRRLL